MMATKDLQPGLLFDESTLPKPAADKLLAAKTAAKPKRKAKAKPVVTESQQPFLPGLSRRGRPRSKNPVPATVRATQSRKRRTEAGVRRVELLLEPEVAARLDALIEHFKVSRVEVVSRLIAQAAKRIPGPAKTE